MPWQVPNIQSLCESRDCVDVAKPYIHSALHSAWPMVGVFLLFLNF